MKHRYSELLLLCAAVVCSAQSAPKPFPAGVLGAKTIAIINDTHTPAVEKGADDALASWGQFKIVDDPQLADITLRFDKKRQHEGRDSQKTGDDGQTSYSYGMSFGSNIEMKAFYKDTDAPFFFTKTDDSKNKAGLSCINSFHEAYRNALQQSKAK